MTIKEAIAIKTAPRNRQARKALKLYWGQTRAAQAKARRAAAMPCPCGSGNIVADCLHL